MLDGVPTNAVNATGLKALYVGAQNFLHARVFGLQVPHAYPAVGHRVAVGVVAVALIVVIEALVLQTGRNILQTAVGVVGHHVDNNLHAILMSFLTQTPKRCFISQTVANDKVVRLVDHVPD